MRQCDKDPTINWRSKDEEKGKLKYKAERLYERDKFEYEPTKLNKWG